LIDNHLKVRPFGGHEPYTFGTSRNSKFASNPRIPKEGEATLIEKSGRVDFSTTL